MMNDEFFRRLDEMTTSDATQVKCYLCDALISKKTTIGGDGLKKPEPPPKGCEFVLCVNCQREICYEEESDLALTYDREPKYCHCKDCKKQFNL